MPAFIFEKAYSAEKNHGKNDQQESSNIHTGAWTLKSQIIGQAARFNVSWPFHNVDPLGPVLSTPKGSTYKLKKKEKFT
jgi:hypothetical protein